MSAASPDSDLNPAPPSAAAEGAAGSGETSPADEPRRDPAEIDAATRAAVRLRPGAKARVAGFALSLSGAATVVCAGLALLYLQAGHPRHALGVFLGHVAAQLVTATWLVGAILSFDRGTQEFMRATLGMSPLRLLVLVTVVVAGVLLTEADHVALFLSLIGTHVYGHVVEGLVLGRLRSERDGPGSEEPSAPNDAAPSPEAEA